MKNSSSLSNLLLGVILAIAGICLTIGFIGVQTGHITIIFGDENEVDNSVRSEKATPEPNKAQPVETKPTQPSEANPTVEAQPQSNAVAQSHHAPSVPQRQYSESDEAEEIVTEEDCECDCVIDEDEEGDEEEPEEEEPLVLAS